MPEAIRLMMYATGHTCSRLIGWAPHSNLVHPLAGALLQLVGDALLGLIAPVRVVELALVAVGALLLVGAGLDVAALTVFRLPQKNVQSWSVSSHRIVRRHEPKTSQANEE